ncbi:MAG: hypothetical protein ACHP85_15575 [Burkholderiales bacterium]|jgi:hypothetical protein
MSRSPSTLALAVLLAAGTSLRASAQTPSPTPTPSPASAPAEDAAPKLTPYASVYFNGFHNSSGTNNQDVPLWATAGTGDTGATARQSRLGVRASLPAVFGAKTSATIEVDFFGGFPAIGTGENFGQVRLRLANMRLDWTKTALVIGQDWMVFAPVNPSSLACAAIPLFAAAGNPWARLPQVRLERRFGAGLVQAAVLAPQSGDFNSAFLAQPNSGSLSEVPYVQGRLAWTSKNAFGSGKPGALGVSGHYGQSQVTTTGGTAKDLDSTGGAVDWSWPLGKHVLLSGEGFLGDNLAGFQAGVFQGYNPDEVTASAPGGTPESISTKGGWAQLAVTPGANLTVLAAYGIDDPDDADLVSATSRNWRTRNEVVALALQYRASAQLSFGIEYRFLETRFLQTGTQKGRHLNLAAVMSF